MDIRLYGDPVLRQRAVDINDVDDGIINLAAAMIQAMYDAPGLGLAAPQVGVLKRMFVYDMHDGTGPQVLINPVVIDTRGECTYPEGCLSIPGLSWGIVRPKQIHLVGYNLDGNKQSVGADGLLARLYQHELDHLDGVLLLDHLTEDQREYAMKILQRRRSW